MKRTKSESKSIRKNQLSSARKSANKQDSRSANVKSDRVARLQQTHGNQAVKRLLEKGNLGTELEESQSNDKHEREADRVAEQVMGMSGAEPDSDSQEAMKVSRKTAAGESAIEGKIERRIESVISGGKPLSSSTRSFFEERFGRSFDDVRVHTGPKANEAAQSIDARAFTHGANVVFRKGEYSPNSLEGKRLLAHELTHVVQQDNGTFHSIQRQQAGQHQQQPGQQQAGQQPDQARQEWEAHPNIHHHFRFPGVNALEEYRRLRPAYQAAGIQNPAQYLANNIIQVQFFGRGIPVHQDLRQPLNNAEAALQNIQPNIANIGGFVPRLTARGNLSNHALGRAIDINPGTNPHIRNQNDIRVIRAVTGVDLGQRQDAQAMRNASQQFQNQFGDAWVQQQRTELEQLNNFMGPLTAEQAQRRTELQELLNAIRARRNQLNEYAQEGFLTLEQPLIDALTNAGFEWGGEWHTEKDFMHFEIDN